MTSPFLIDQRFAVNAATNTLKDRQSGTVERLEPRQMKLLCALAERQGQLVERSDLITRLWGDHGGADDAITQAVCKESRNAGYSR
ncbi:MAG: winged helix-turn-helix domain-containing protein [Flavobacteriales bacterium]